LIAAEHIKVFKCPPIQKSQGLMMGTRGTCMSKTKALGTYTDMNGDFLFGVEKKILKFGIFRQDSPFVF
jgi:hypothetical protein